MNILFCTDGSLISFNTIKNFSKLFNSVNADIICVSDMTYIPDHVLMHAGKYIQQCTASTDTILEHATNVLKNCDIKVNNFIKRCGNAVDYILDIERKIPYDFIVMGSNGKKGIQKWLGSVSQEVASNSKTSVYISKSVQENKNILFPVTYDGLLNGELKQFTDMMNLTNSQIHLLNVYEIPEFLFLEGNIDSNWVCDIEMKQQKEAGEILNAVEMIFVEKGIPVKNKSVIKGNITEQILKYIKQHSISHVVLKMRNKKPVSKFTFSSVSRRILENAPCDVLIYKD